MKKTTSFISIILILSALLMSGCSYRRISFGSEQALGEMCFEYIDENTKAICNVENTFPEKMPIYKIREREITDSEYQKTLEVLNVSEEKPLSGQSIERNGNYLHISLDSYASTSRGFYDMTDEELEASSREIFSKLPFYEGKNYVYADEVESYVYRDGNGSHYLRKGACFTRVTDEGYRIKGDSCFIIFDGSGFVELRLSLFDYEKTSDEMKLISFEEAKERILTPDSFTQHIDSLNPFTIGMIDNIEISKVSIYYVNQFKNGSKILEPVYSFTGEATDVRGNKAGVTSVVIALPESFKYYTTKTQYYF